jgi:hypothetical protein
VPRAPSAQSLTGLVREHALQSILVSRIGDHALVQFLFAFVRFRGQDVTAKGMITNHFARTRFLESFRRTFVSLELRHSYSLDLFEQERLTEYSTPTGAVDRGHFSDGGS